MKYLARFQLTIKWPILSNLWILLQMITWSVTQQFSQTWLSHFEKNKTASIFLSNKVYLLILKIHFLKFIFWLHHTACWIWLPWPGIKPTFSALEAWSQPLAHQGSSIYFLSDQIIQMFALFTYKVNQNVQPFFTPYLLFYW